MCSSDLGQTGFYNLMLQQSLLGAVNWWEGSCAFNRQMTYQARETSAAIPTNYRYYIGTGSRHTMFGSNKVYDDTTGGVPTIAIDHDDTPTQTRLAEVARQQLATVGITATPRPHPAAEYDDFLANGDPELFRLGWVASDPSAEAFMLPVFATGAPENVAHISSLAADLTEVAASRTADAAARSRLYRRAERSVLEQIAVKPVAQYRTRYLARSRVRGLAVDLLGGIFADYAGLADG